MCPLSNQHCTARLCSASCLESITQVIVQAADTPGSQEEVPAEPVPVISLQEREDGNIILPATLPDMLEQPWKVKQEADPAAPSEVGACDRHSCVCSKFGWQRFPHTVLLSGQELKHCSSSVPMTHMLAHAP